MINYAQYVNLAKYDAITIHHCLSGWPCAVLLSLYLPPARGDDREMAAAMARSEQEYDHQRQQRCTLLMELTGR